MCLNRHDFCWGAISTCICSVNGASKEFHSSQKPQPTSFLVLLGDGIRNHKKELAKQKSPVHKKNVLNWTFLIVKMFFCRTGCPLS